MVDASSGSARFDTFHRTRGPWHFVGRIVERERRQHGGTKAPLRLARWLTAMESIENAGIVKNRRAPT
jgi:hypothetical protein